MKGLIFNLLEEVVTREHGEQAWPDLVDACDVGGSYTSLGSYPDEDLTRLVDALAAVLVPGSHDGPGDILRWFGRGAVPLLAARFPHHFAAHRNARAFVRSANAMIHPEVRKLHPGASCPHFHFADGSDGALLIAYRSPRRLCALAEGLVTGASDHYAQTVTIEHRECMMRAAPQCRLEARWPA